MIEIISEPVVWRCSVKRFFLKIPQKFMCAKAFAPIKLQALQKKLWQRCFYVNFVNFSLDHLCELLLSFSKSTEDFIKKNGAFSQDFVKPHWAYGNVLFDKELNNCLHAKAALCQCNAWLAMMWAEHQIW